MPCNNRFIVKPYSHNPKSPKARGLGVTLKGRHPPTKGEHLQCKNLGK